MADVAGKLISFIDATAGTGHTMLVLDYDPIQGEHRVKVDGRPVHYFDVDRLLRTNASTVITDPEADDPLVAQLSCEDQGKRARRSAIAADSKVRANIKEDELPIFREGDDDPPPKRVKRNRPMMCSVAVQVDVASADFSSIIDDVLTCPITHERFVDPVIAYDGITYERAAVNAWIRKQIHEGQPRTSPKTGAPMAIPFLVPNVAIRKLLAEVNEKGM